MKANKKLLKEGKEIISSEIAVNIFLYWENNESEPWYIDKNLPDVKIAKTAFAREMWIEEIFGYMKKKGLILRKP